MAYSPSAAFDRLEGIKENVQPIKRGRDTNKLGLGNHPTGTKGLRINNHHPDQYRETERL